MRKLALLAVFSLLLAGTVSSSALAGAKGSDRPFSGSVAGMAVFDLTNQLGCAAGVTTLGEATGTAGHLGQVTMRTAHCPLPDGTVSNAEMTLIAANGDEVFGTYTGSSALVGDYVLGSYNVVFAGGTGRFAHATGTAVIHARVLFLGFTVLEWPGTWSWTGTISY